MIFLKLLLVLAAAFALYWQIKIKKTFPTIITVGMVVGIIMVLMLPKTFQLTGFFIYMGFVLLALIYGFIVREKAKGARIVILLMSAGIFTYWLWILNHWHGNELLAALLTLIVGVVAIFSKVRLRNELGFLVLLASDAVVILIERLL